MSIVGFLRDGPPFDMSMKYQVSLFGWLDKILLKELIPVLNLLSYLYKTCMKCKLSTVKCMQLYTVVSLVRVDEYTMVLNSNSTKI